ncbi:PREDICTED: probable disease resistance protein At5g66900 [Prunus mume]|uniref:Probable disease resistance protein At5g66900 n=1 Tax=Prunus mume TaxID=102107 RepID=A0ABM0PM11_PRUMU|nr:PREDICTED: probable disease resistance protein At5g66900 [Prunus mume]
MDPVTLVVGSALGAAFEILFSAVLKAKSTANMFQTHLGNLNATLDSLKPVIKQLESANRLVPLEKSLENFTTKMEEGKKLVDECCEVWRIDLIKQHKYTGKIEALDDSLHRLLSILSVQLGSHSAMMLHRIGGNVVAQNKNQIGVRCAVPPLPLVIVGLDAPLDDLEMKLLGDGTESILVLTAAGGCGKTTLATMFCHDPRVKAKFKENIFFATVSNKVSYLIVQELCEHAGLEVPALQDEVNPFKWLQKFMTERGQNPLLLVLDDVQSESESLLDKFNEFKMPSCKVLVTSRYHFPKFGRTYPLDTLEDKAAMDLFRRSAFLPNTSSSDIPDDLQEEIVRLCKRFPLSLKAIGDSLRNQPIQIWERKVRELSKGSILGADKELLAYLKSCLDDLDEGMATVKNCFIDLGLFPEDRIIPVTALLDMWAEYEGTEDFLSIANLYELTNRNLARLVVVTGNEDVDGYYGEHFVIQHDMLRLLSIHESCEDPKQQRLIIGTRGDELPTWWKEMKHNTKNARLVSISTDGLSSAKWDNMDLPKAEVLVLNFQTENYVLPKCVKQMSKLKVLIVTNYGVLQADLSNFKLLGSLPNLKRIRLERVSIPSISKKSMQLKGLQKISLFMCSIGQAFSNSSIQILEAFPNLVELNIDYCNDLVELPAKLCDLIHLKKLSITNCVQLSALPDEIGKLDDLEVLRLRSCTDLERLPDSIKNLSKLNLLDMYYCFNIKELPEQIGEMSGLRKIKMVQCLRLLRLPASVLNLEQLREVICDKDTEILWGEPFKSNLTNINIRVVKEDFKRNWLHDL